MVRLPLELKLIDRHYQPDDFSSLSEIEGASGEASWNQRVLLGFLTRSDTRCHVIVRAGQPRKPIAFFVVQRRPSELYIANLAVAPDSRNIGVGSFALDRVEHLGECLECARIELHVQESNLAAQLLYRKMGYRAVEILKNGYDDQDAYRMVKRL